MAEGFSSDGSVLEEFPYYFRLFKLIQSSPYGPGIKRLVGLFDDARGDIDLAADQVQELFIIELRSGEPPSLPDEIRHYPKDDGTQFTGG
ncbi:MAG TPA: hypothetical protein DCZ69_06915 [Syntrophobacteraceae bacterium]|nr:hypothetical protein [Syntrophobacteraceae bacterium]